MSQQSSTWLPASVLAFRQYTFTDFRHDLIAGVTVGCVAMPLAIAFAIASGVAPQAGIACAIVTGLIISGLGGSRTQIGGPTGAFVVVVSGIIAQHGLTGLYVCTMMAGVILIILGVTGTGTAVKFIPRPVIIGFTNGIAVLIATTQIRDFLGVQGGENTGELIERMRAIGQHLDTVSPAAVTLALASLAVILLANRYIKGIPGTVLAMVLGTAVAWAFTLPVETVAARFGALPSSLPEVHLPAFQASAILGLLSPAFTVAMLGAIESLMSAVVADRMTGDRHNPNVELVAQGLANVASPLVGGLPATGAIARTATNIRSGARTPMAGIVHAVTLLVLLLAGASLVGRIPMAVLAAILLTVAWRMGEWHEIPGLLRQGWADRSVWFVTFALTVFADLTVAVEVGMIIAALLFIRRVSLTTTVSRVTHDYLHEGREHVLQDKEIPDNVAIYRIHGPFLFGATDKIERIAHDLPRLPPVVIFRLRNMTAIDATGLEALEDMADRIRASGRTAIFCGAREQPAALLERAGFVDYVGKENVQPHVRAALDRAAAVIAASGRTLTPAAS
jgi:SulP family sulfate permease